MTRPGRLLTTFMDVVRGGPKKIEGWDVAQLRDRLNMAARRGVKFISPHSVKMDESKPILLSDLRPPYPVTVFEGELFEGVFPLIIARDAGEHVELNLICRMNERAQEMFPEFKEWFNAPYTCRFRYSDASIHDPYEMELNPFRRGYTWDKHTTYGTGHKPLLRFYFGVCQILAYHDVETTDVLADAKEARSRRIRGKAPLFTYKTLTIGARKARPAGKGGGTHASPRSHLRRGFYRTSKHGVRHWVQATVVKGDTPGFIHKDYRIK
jgi:hypothetical protein